MTHGETLGVASFRHPTAYPMQYFPLPAESEKRIKNEILREYSDFKVPISRENYRI
jgi:hypothetical protein